ncbi:hypothetical protein ONE63_001072 [Megalurothrips usitatus]|uniref:Uncharacterized protein n=1 Tax=Megalurothrips usitatus TaxID=439358 RepID=A0AAV7XFK2_9NEOP|nr:hypothetical protein ONE63_001072 [Megalurothrips usitatus]
MKRTLIVMVIAVASSVSGLFHPAPEFMRYATTLPRIYHGREKRETSTTKSGTGKEHAPYLTIGLKLEDRQLILDLSLNRGLISDSYFESHRENGQHMTNRPTSKGVELCQYQGSLRGIRNSWAAVSTCNGLSGVVFDGQEVHYMEPVGGKLEILNGSNSLGATYHYKHSDLHRTNDSCGDEGFPGVLPKDTIHLHRSTRSTGLRRDNVGMDEPRGPYNANNKTRYVELVVVADHKEYLAMDSNIEKVRHRCRDIANIVNALYSPLNIFVALVGVVVWSEVDEIELVPNADTTLNNFLRYRRERLLISHPNDNAQLITRFRFENGVVGKALKGPICTYEFSGAISSDYSSAVGMVATTVAHMMGHNFGMEHDTSDCECSSKHCLMAASSLNVLPTQWSSCSQTYVALAFHHGMDYCLRNKPPKLFGGPVCGNGFVESGEQCDCGSESNCRNPCCNPATCMLHANASCATGECCDLETCQLKPAGDVCRGADRECDLPEFCTGSSEYCPVDVFKMDGESCNQEEAFCYRKSCRTRSEQCRLLWGPSGRSSDRVCYELNTKGTRHGNCGYNRTNQTYTKCENDDVYCGMLQCSHASEKLEFGMESVAILSHAFVNKNGSIVPCRTVMVDLGLNDVDPGLAPDGSKCGEGKMCVNQTCWAVNSFRAASGVVGCPQNCNGNGVCNSKGHCHCNLGFSPPHCDTSGAGGSEDSGPPATPG